MSGDKMHYYQFNIGDYSSHTSRLNPYEDLAYRRLLDLYYLSERPFNGCSTDIAKEIGLSDSIGDVDYILNKYFTENNGVWSNKRCDREIKAYKDKKKSARKAGIASGKARKTNRTDVERTLNTEATDVEPNINHKPLTINHKPITSKDSAVSTKQPAIPYDKIIELYHDTLPELPKVSKISDKRKRYIKKLWNKDDLEDLECWENFFLHVRKSTFLMGWGKNNFKANFEWIITPSNFTKIYEGNYHGKV